jgi:hypothetical protein
LVQRQEGSDRWSALDRRGRDIVERLGGRWQRGGGMCRCPGHDDHTPSLSVRTGDRRLLFHCFAGCGTGTVIRALVGLRLIGAGLPTGGGDSMSRPPDPGRCNRIVAAMLWAAARPIPASPAEAYLRGRGLALAVCDLRYHPGAPFGRGAEAIFRPALLAAVRDDSGLAGVHRTFLEPRSAGLAELCLAKRALGRLGTGAVRLRPPLDGMLGLAEGIENAIAATQITGIPCWATLGAERFARVAIPKAVRRLILFLDNDPGGRRAEKLARQVHGGGVEIETRYPAAAGADWNDALLHSDAP